MSNADAPIDRRAIFTQPNEQPLDLKGLVDTFARRWKLFVAVSVGCLLLAIIVSLILRPSYEAVANIRIDPTQKSAIDLEAAARGAAPDQALVDSEVKIIQSADVAAEVVRTLNLVDDPEFNPAMKHGETPVAASPAATQVTIEHVLKHLDVARLGSTYIIAVRFHSPYASKATNIANAFAREYLLTSVKTKVDAASEQSTWLTDRLNAAGQAAQKADAALAQYRANNGILTSASGGTVTEQQIATLTTELASAEGAAAAAESTYSAAKAQVAGNTIDNISSVINSPTIVELRKEHAELLSKQAEVNSRYGPKHPETAKVTQQVLGIEAQMRDESQRIVAGLESDARAAQAKAQSLRTNLSALRGQMGANSQAGVQADSLQRDADAKKTIFNQLAASAQQANQQQHLSDASAQIVGRATVPTHPAFPNKALFAALGAALGLILGAAAVFVAELLDAGVRTVEDVERHLGVNFIASTQLLTPRDLTVDGQEVRPWDYVVSRPMSGYAEAMRNTRSAIMLSDLDKQQKVVAITSALPSEGKTVCSVSLARVMAMSGEKVILVDCDLRRNALEGLLATPPAAGLIEVLTGEAKLDDVIVPDAVKGLDLLPLNKAAFSPRDLFGTNSMNDLLVELRKRYDHVVLDGPPILAVTDARTLAKMADAVILIAHWNRTPRYAIQAAVARLVRDQAPIAGLLLTMVDKKSRSAMGAGDPGYYYGQYHKYYHD